MNDADGFNRSDVAPETQIDFVEAVAAIAGYVERSGGRVVAIHIDGSERPWPDGHRSSERRPGPRASAMQAEIVDPRMHSTEHQP